MKKVTCTFLGTKEFLSRNVGLLTMQMDTAKTAATAEGQSNSIDACNKETGGKKTALQKWSRGLHHFVRGGGIIEKFDPLFV